MHSTENMKNMYLYDYPEFISVCRCTSVKQGAAQVNISGIGHPHETVEYAKYYFNVNVFCTVNQEKVYDALFFWR